MTRRDSAPTDREHARLERLAITVPDIDRWIGLFESLLGPGFRRATVQQRTGPTEVAIHPAGLELVAGPSDEAPTLRSFHLTTPDLDHSSDVALHLGWHRVDQLILDGRRHEVFDADGLRLLLLDAVDPSQG